ncbi:hypothetical protein L2221_26690, partial [Xanthomonas perforans]|nr:hypothetical protein [Xanthomonas perforans]
MSRHSLIALALLLGACSHEPTAPPHEPSRSESAPPPAPAQPPQTPDQTDALPEVRPQAQLAAPA